MSKVTSLRLPEELYDRIQREAEEDGRSITKQIEYMIKQFYEIKSISTRH